jgi:hypothetical protein
MVPFVDVRNEGLALFFSSRDEKGRSSTGCASLDLSSAGAKIAAKPEPVLCPGPLGGFDDSGAMGACMVRHNGREHLYYIGWTTGRSVPFVLNIGLAISENGGRTFERVSRGPVLGRSDADPFLVTSPWVLIENGRWRMWYVSGTGWERTESGPRYYSRIVYAESADGVSWEPSGRVCIDFGDPDEYVIARPCVLRDHEGYHMWFSSRGAAYRIGYARSADGLTWIRDDEEAGLWPTGEDWESRSVEYSFVFDQEAVRWILYNGNDYGATGIGLARWEDAL